MPPYIEGGTAIATASHRVSVPAVLLAMAPLAFSDSGCAVGEERDPRGIYRGAAPQSPNAGAAGEPAVPRGTAGSGGGAAADPDDHTPPSEDASVGSGGAPVDASAPDASKGGAGGKPDGGASSGGASAGAAGSAAGSGPTCSTDPKPGAALEPNSKWRVQVSGTGFAIEPCDPSYATDGDESSRWCNGSAQAGKEWFKLDLGEEQCVSEVQLLSNSADFPVAYELFLSTDGKQLTSVAKGKGAVDLKIGFPRQRARHIEIRQTGVSSNGKWWSLYELTVRR